MLASTVCQMNAFELKLKLQCKVSFNTLKKYKTNVLPSFFT